ncbi:MAG: hypothetical protein ABL974_12655 [Prosthecobacter sp.]
MIRFLLVSCLAFAGYSFSADLKVGEPVFGSDHYTEYVPGELPLVISSPHGGALKPESVANRTSGVRDADANTQDLARRIAAEIQKQTGKQTHLIISHLHRSKLDPNREIVEAAQGDKTAEKVWAEYHAFIDQALKAAVARHGRAFFIDLHGQSHKDVRVELGYMHSTSSYAQTAAELNGPEFIATGSLKLITQLHPDRPYTDLILGPQSLGALLEERGFLATPSPRMPVPTEPYFRGGYTVARHVVADLKIAGLQIEANRIRLRDTSENRQRFAESLVSALQVYLPKWMNLELK